MQNLFGIILNMSVSAVPVILFVLCLRQLFKKQPKSYSFALWLLVFTSLVIPFKVPVKVQLPTEKITEHLAQTIVQEFAAETRQNNIIVNNTVPETEKKQQNTTPIGGNTAEQNLSAAAPVQQAETAKLFTLQLWHIWLCGILVLLAFEIVNLKGIYDKTRFAFKKQGNIYLCDEISKPFVFGIVKPKIFLPSDISLQDEHYVIQHEQTHIDRKDYIVKPLCFAVAALHWFNPLVWLGFYLMEKDMELSCDEKVAKTLDTAGIQQYCASLLTFAVKDKPYKINAVLFGEGNCTMRIKNILNFKQPKKITAILLSICVLLAGCTAFATVENIEENTENVQTFYIENLETGVTKTITDENDVAVISGMLSSQNWQEGTADCLSEFSITLNGDKYYYHSDCGTINDSKNNRSLSLDDGQKMELDRIIAGSPQVTDDEVCGYPKQEYFSETEENATETETADQWAGFPEVIHLPMLEAGGYIWPTASGQGVRISRGFSDGSRYPLIPTIENENIKSINKGKVTDIYNDNEYGKVVVIESYNEADEANSTIHYPYCKEIFVRVGEKVESGQSIAVLSEQIREEEYRCQAENTVHKGIDIAGAYGTDIVASADGKVIKSEESSVGDGNCVVIEHKNGYFTLYAHCSQLLVKEGDEVKQGNIIAKMGSTGNSTGNHLHFEFGFGYGSEPDGGIRLDPYTAL